MLGRGLALVVVLAAGCGRGGETAAPRARWGEACRRPEGGLEGVWDAARRGAAARGVRGVKADHLARLAETAVEEVERAAKAWTRQRAATCSLRRRRGAQGDAWGRALCEERARSSLEAMIRRLEAGDGAAIEASEAAADQVETILEGCRARRREGALAGWIAVEEARLAGILAADEEALAAVLRGLGPAARAQGAARLVVAGAALRSGATERAAQALAGREGAEAEGLRVRLHGAQGEHEAAAAAGRRVVEAAAPGPGWAPLGRPAAAVIDDLLQAAAALRRVGDYEAALGALARARALAAVHHGDAPRRQRAAIHEALGLVYGNLGAYAEAVTEHQAALEIRRARVGELHPDTARSHHHLGAAYEATARLALARRHYERALAIRMRALGEHPLTARTYNNLGNLALREGALDEALRLHAAARAIRAHAYGEDHAETATSDVNLGMVELARGDPQAALQRLQRALAIRVRVLGEAHPYTAIVHNNLGLALAALGEVDRALEHHREALAIRRAFFGDEHLEVARSHHNLGALLLARGALDEARPHLEAALRTRRGRLPPGHPEVESSRQALERLKRASEPLPDEGWSL